MSANELVTVRAIATGLSKGMNGLTNAVFKTRPVMPEKSKGGTEGRRFIMYRGQDGLC